MRIAALGFNHESNTFAPMSASADRWREAGLLEDDAVVAAYRDSEATMAGFLEVDHDDVEVIPLFFARLTPMGTITDEAYNLLTGRVLSRLQSEGPWDAVLLAQHGAAVAESFPDADGELVSRVRDLVGPEVPIGVSLDMHANVSERLVDHATVVTAYMTNPHLDARLRARECADLLVATVRGEVRPTSSLATPPVAVDILRQGTSDAPMRDLVNYGRRQAEREGVLSTSVVEGFPYADVPHMGMTFIAVTNDDPELATSVAEELARAAWDVRHDLVGEAPGIDDGLLYAATVKSAPVVLMDVGDNVGGGSPGDSTHVLEAAQRLGIPGVFISLNDPDAVEICRTVGTGGTVHLEVGGKTDHLHGDPVAVTGEVVTLTDGRFRDTGDTHGGFTFYDNGPSALITTDDEHDILLTTRALGNTSRQQLVSVGIDPEKQPIMVAKGVHSPRGAFEPIAAEMIWLSSPGCTAADLTQLPYQHRRQPMFPWEPEAQW